MARALARHERGELAFTPQSRDGVTYAHKITNEECRLDWHEPARRIVNRVRGLSPHPGAFLEIDLGRGAERLKILRCAPADGAGAPGTLLDEGLTIACGVGAIRVTELQRAGRKPVAAADFLRGSKPPAGIVLA
jgi:methionyl-tRNA formyltransferase